MNTSEERVAEAMVSRDFAAFRQLLPAKTRAAGIHIAISFVVFLVLLYFIFFEWYPQPYFAVDGGWQGIRILFGVDVVLGPALTFVIFNPAKRRREIVTDLSLVVLLQISALVWGVFTVHDQRPVAIVAFDGTLGPVVADAYEKQGIDIRNLAQFDARQPPLIFQRVPHGAEFTRSIGLRGSGVDRSAQMFLYERFDERLPELFANAAAWERRATSAKPELRERLERVRAAHGADVAFLPFGGRYGEAVVAFSRTGEVVDSFEN